MNTESINKLHQEISRLSMYMGKKLNSEQKTVYVDSLRQIPIDFLIATFDGYIKHFPPGSPRNFPSIQDLIDKWNASGAQLKNMASHFRRSPCDDCRGEGILWYRVPDDRSKSGFYERCCKCGSCDNHIQHGPMPRLQFQTKQQLIARDFKVWPYPKEKVVEKVIDISGLLNDIDGGE